MDQIHKKVSHIPQCIFMHLGLRLLPTTVLCTEYTILLRQGFYSTVPGTEFPMTANYH